MVSQGHGPTTAQVEAWKANKAPLIRDLTSIHHEFGNANDPSQFIDKIFKSLERAETIDYGLDTDGSQWLDALNAYGRLDIWWKVPALKAFLVQLQVVYHALGAQCFSKPLTHPVPALRKLSRSDAATAIQRIHQKLVRLRVPRYLRVEVSSSAAVKLCQEFVRQGYFRYRVNDPRRHDYASLMLIMELDLERELLPVTALFSELEPENQRRVVGARQRHEWKEYAMMFLGNQRALQAWEILHTEDTIERNHMLSDLSGIMQNRQGRQKLNISLQTSFVTHLLHAGSSTVSVLDEFMLIIRTLNMRLPSGRKVDESGVILDQAAYSIKSFLRQREDAARIVIQSLLDPKPGTHDKPPASEDGYSGRIALAMYNHEKTRPVHKPFEGQDLLDMNWTPKPTDARPTHNETAMKDDIGHVTSIQDDTVFLQELESVLAERFLTKRTDEREIAKQYSIEQQLLEMFKARFNEETGDKTVIQRSEIMLSDMFRSRDLNKDLDESVLRRSRDDLEECYVHVLSREYWPNVRGREATHFKSALPEHLWSQLEENFDATTDGNMSLKRLQELGRVEIELGLQERRPRYEVTEAQASVIYAFSEDAQEAKDTMPIDEVQLTVDDLVARLEMSDVVVRQAIGFWMEERVLRKVPGREHTYEVLEKLTTEDRGGQSHLANKARGGSPNKSELGTQEGRIAQLQENYGETVMAIVTNMGPIAATDIKENLEIYGGGFPHEVGELEALLEHMMASGQVHKEGIMWKV